MCDIDEIMDMFSWNSSPEVQQKGIELARNVRCLNAFLLPIDSRHSKDVWENCAIVLSEKSDEELSPYLMELLDWLVDLTWPGAMIILERLLKYDRIPELAQAVEIAVKVGKALNDENWIVLMSNLLDNQKLADALSESTRKEIIRLVEEAQRWDSTV